MNDTTQLIELIKQISYGVATEQGYVRKFDGIVVSVNKEDNTAEVTIVGYDIPIKFNNKTNEILDVGDSVKIESLNESLTDAFISEKFGTSGNLAENEIKELIVEFAVNDSPIVAPSQDDPNWSSLSIERPLNRYIWQRIKTIYANKETFSTPVNITGANGDSPPLCNIYGENVFKFDINKELISKPIIKLTAEVVNTTINSWQYQNESEEWVVYPTSDLNLYVNNDTLNVSATEDVFFNNVANIRCVTNLTDILDVVSIVKIYDGESGYTVLLSNENTTFAGDVLVKPTTIVSLVQAYTNIESIPTFVGEVANIPIGMSITIQNNNTTNTSITISVNQDFVEKNGELEIPIYINSKLFSKTFSYSTVINGKEGVSVDNIIDQFAINNSKTIPPTESSDLWQDTQPIWQPNFYLWKRSKVTYSDNSISYTQPFADTTWELVEDLDIKLSEELKAEEEARLEALAEVSIELNGLQKQIDGEISSWFYEGVPTLENEPAVNWVTEEEKHRHVQDTYTNIEQLDINIQNTILQFDDGISETNAIVEIIAKENIALGTSIEKNIVGGGSGNKISAAYPFSTTELLEKKLTFSFNYQITGENISGQMVLRLTGSPYTLYIPSIDLINDSVNFAKNTLTITQNPDTPSISLILTDVPETCSIRIWNFKIEESEVVTTWIPNVNDGIEMPVFNLVRCGKNLLPNYRPNSQTINGITYTNNQDGTANISGLSTGYSQWQDTQSLQLPKGNYFFSTGLLKSIAQLRSNNIVTVEKDRMFELKEDKQLLLRMLTYNNVNIENEIASPQIEVGNFATSYEQYRGESFVMQINTPTEIEIKDGINTFYTNEGALLNIEYQTRRSGQSYKFVEENGNYSWLLISDSALSKALQEAAEAQSTADGKSTTFFITPTNYKKGDGWILQEDWNVYKQGDILNALEDSKEFNSSHWVKLNIYVDMLDVDDRVLPLVEYNTSLIQSEIDRISLEVSTTYTKNDELVAFQETIIQQTSSDIEFVRETLNADILGVTNEVNNNQMTLEEYIRFEGSQIEIGRSDSNIISQIDNDEFRFMVNGQKTTYIDALGGFNFTNGAIKNKLTIGVITLFKEEDGLSFI